MDIETVRMTEERLVNVWPAVSTLLMDGWVVRFANGYSGRANSASAVVPGARMSGSLIRHIEALYHQAGLPPSVRTTPLCAPEVEPMLLERGYCIKDEAIMMTASLARFAGHSPSPQVAMDSKPHRQWLQGISDRQEPSKSSEEHLMAIVGQIRVPAAFATLIVKGQSIGFAMAAVDRGWAEISAVMLDEAHRGKGLGRILVEALLIWAAQAGARDAFLQVSARNDVANGLYRSLGFTELCRYRTLIRP
jgi:N-acetylglutamate synthase